MRSFKLIRFWLLLVLACECGAQVQLKNANVQNAKLGQAVASGGGGGGGSFPTGSLIDLKFNGDVLDASGNVNNGAVTGTTTFTTGQDTIASHAFSFNGSTTVNQSDATVANFTSSDFSISFWVKVTSGNLATTPIPISKGLFQQSGYYIFFTAAGAVTVTLNQGSANQDTVSSTGVIVEGSWKHVCFVRSGTSGKIYVNGSDVTSSAPTLINPVGNGINPFRIGSYSGAGNSYNGAMDEVAVWARALSGAEVSAIFSLNAQ